MASSSTPLSTFVPPVMKDEEPRNWAELPSELTSSILLRLGVVEILESAQKVCTSWRRVSKDPSLWRKINMQDNGTLNFDSMCRHAVDRSQGGLIEINIRDFGDKDLLNYIADRSSNLRSLGLGLSLFRPYFCSDKELVNAFAKLPLLETLEISQPWFKLNLKDVGHACPHLKTFKLNYSGYIPCDDDDYAFAIAESMTELRHLQLLGNRLTDVGLNAILDNIPHLEHLDLRKCFNINLVGNLEKRCLERIKELRRPHDSTDDYPFDIIFHHSDDDDLDYIYGGDDIDEFEYDYYGDINHYWDIY